ncbi:DUF3800 domain-containing protein [Bradyrhizobium sp. PMVTL-01]|uniref:DUF3800 domain-containing protein n=1 Tax=Bradyrhizobium sp. PMVTL-01 TaxID=3434999 RepID=UPI003F6F8507
MYVDESGDSGLVNSPTEYFVLSGLVVHESRWRDFLAALIALRRKLRANYGLPVRTEIHAAHFINKKPIDLPRNTRLATLRVTIDELAKLDYVSITNIVTKKAGKAADYDVFLRAWQTLFQRFENTLTAGNFPGGHRDDYGIVITDATSGKKLSQLVRKMAVINYIPNNAWFGAGSRNLPITRVIEDPYGKDSAHTLPVQMADVAAYFLHQKYKPSAYIKRQHAEMYFDRLQPVLNRVASRNNALGIVEL